MKRAFSVLTALGLAACATVAPTPLPGPTAGFGKIAITSGPRVRPRSIVEDSRCPINARCVWAGRLILRADVLGPTWVESRDFELGKRQPIRNGAITLIAAEPGKLAGTQTQPSAYRFTFQFDPAP
jgi:hypothetical protein